MKQKDIFTRSWIIRTGVPIVKSYGGNLTLRALHYRLVAKGMTNTLQHYKRVVTAMIDARWDGLVDFDDFLDHERDVEGETLAEPTDLDSGVIKAKEQIEAWMKHYSKHRWENQPIYPEVFIEKKALQGVFDRPCRKNRVALCPCKGYPSLTYIFDASKRFQEAIDRGQTPLILYWGDYDPSGEDIPRSIGETLRKMGVTVEVRRCALMEEQVIEWGLPPAPTKMTDSRSGAWEGLGQVELDAVEPNMLQRLCQEAIDSVFDTDLHDELIEQQEEEVKKYRTELKSFVKTL